ncbi:MAG: T9SS type A sorting domain-containing protein, partial [Bacteroidales bacterium]|nr:T9SS type A sorting domain-containing protein [Bacteroidales bacterium]
VQSGDYAVEITQNDCTDISECQNVIITEIISNEFENKVKIYPNPTKGNITIDLGEQNENVTIKIYDSAGKQIKSFESSGESIINLEITGFAGIYYVDIIKANGDKVNFKIIKTE